MSSEQRGLTGFVEDAQAWRAAVGGRVPVYDRLLEAAAALVTAPADAAERAARERLEAAWRERRFSAAYARPLLLLAALRAEAARAGSGHPLHAAIVGEPPRVEAATRGALAEALAGAPARLHVDLATRTVQTNETSRAVAWLWPAQLAGCDAGARPLALADVGCSAGLNLVGDALPRTWHDPSGAALPTVTGPRVVARLGFDAHPLDVARPGDVAWLRACVWPGETTRLARLDQAIAAFQDAAASARADAPRLELGDVADVPDRLERAATALPGDAVFVAYQTVVREYLPAPVRERHARAMRAWVAARAGAARVFVELEADPDPEAEPATPFALTAHLADRAGTDVVRTVVLARCSYHPTLVVPDAAATEFLRKI
jgi:hypothetical protein